MKPQTLQLLPTLPAGLPNSMESRIVAALDGNELTQCERAVLTALVFSNPPRLGSKRALGISHLQQRWAGCNETVWTDRTVKAAVKSLLENHEIKVGSGRGEFSGYFLIVDAQDAAIAAAPLLSEAVSLLHRAHLLGVDTRYVRELFGQEVLAS